MSTRTRRRQPRIGEELECVREQSNAVDRYAVAVLKDNTIVGHLPKSSPRIYSLFLRRGGVIWCHVEGRRKYSDLPQGIKFMPDKNLPPQVLGETGQNFPPAKITCYMVSLQGMIGLPCAPLTISSHPVK